MTDLLDLLPDGVVVADGEGRVTAINTVAARMLDAGPPEAAIGRRLDEVLALTDHDGRAWTTANANMSNMWVHCWR